MPRRPNPDWEGANRDENARTKGTERASLDVDDQRLERREARKQQRAEERNAARQTPKINPVALKPYQARGLNLKSTGTVEVRAVFLRGSIKVSWERHAHVRYWRVVVSDEREVVHTSKRRSWIVTSCDIKGLSDGRIGRELAVTVLGTDGNDLEIAAGRGTVRLAQQARVADKRRRQRKPQIGLGRLDVAVSDKGLRYHVSWGPTDPVSEWIIVVKKGRKITLTRKLPGEDHACSFAHAELPIPVEILVIGRSHGKAIVTGTVRIDS